MRAAAAVFRASRGPAAAALTAATAWPHRGARAEAWEEESRFQELPRPLSSQAFRPNVPYPGWDNGWDCCDLSLREVARKLGHEWPIADLGAAVRKLYAEHTEKSPADVDAIIAKADGREDGGLAALYRKAYLEHAFGGAATRHIILVRHGQYDEQKQLAGRLLSENPHNFGMPGDTKYPELDAAQVLTPLGRTQAKRTGDRLAELLQPVFNTPGRESDVRLHVSTRARARETAEVIASRLPAGRFRVVPPDPNLGEGDPPAHIIPYAARGGEDFLLKRRRDVHVEGARLEAAFRSLFYRDLPCKRAAQDGRGSIAEASLSQFVDAGGSGDAACGGDAGGDGDSSAGTGVTAATGSKRTGSKRRRTPRHEYDIVVCHMNVIRYFTLRALQLPPEAWLRLGGFNGSLAYLTIRPNGSVSLQAFGDFGHLPLDEVTFGMTQGYAK